MTPMSKSQPQRKEERKEKERKGEGRGGEGRKEKRRKETEQIYTSDPSLASSAEACVGMRAQDCEPPHLNEGPFQKPCL